MINAMVAWSFSCDLRREETSWFVLNAETKSILDVKEWLIIEDIAVVTDQQFIVSIFPKIYFHVFKINVIIIMIIYCTNREHSMNC